MRHAVVAVFAACLGLVSLQSSAGDRYGNDWNHGEHDRHERGDPSRSSRSRIAVRRWKCRNTRRKPARPARMGAGIVECDVTFTRDGARLPSRMRPAQPPTS
jgi:hypothetical protein